MTRFKRILNYNFNLDADRDSEENVIKSITSNIYFRGANLWTLIFAIIVASVGLNVNSTAVIIGAMLISPLMGPIMGVGLGIAISDFVIVRKGIKNLLIAVLISVITSAIYFTITPLHNVNSELLARTTPTIWDVFIAFAGGLAGIVGATRKEKSNVIPGVAIATALMPPLCTAGFGLATGHWFFFLGAMYLFFINSVFICVATVLIVRFMGFHQHVFEDEAIRKRMTRYILIVVIVTIIPSIWLGYGIAKKAIFESNAERFVSTEFHFANTQVVTKNYNYNRKNSTIELLLIGQALDTNVIYGLTKRLPSYKLKGTNLIIRQGLNGQREIDFAQIKASLMDEVFKEASLASSPANDQAVSPVAPFPDIRGEVNALFPQIEEYSLYRAAVIYTDTTSRTDSLIMFVADYNRKLTTANQKSIQRWMSAKFPEDSVQVSFRQAKN